MQRRGAYSYRFMSWRNEYGRGFTMYRVFPLSVSFTASGASGSASPGQFTRQAQSNTERPIASFMISRNSAARVAAKVISAGAYKMPLRGERLAPIPRQALAQGSRSGSNLRYYGGPTIASASVYNIYVNNSASYWGDPGAFITNWNAGGTTTFLHLLDQYISTSANGRYPYGGGIQVTYNTSAQLGDQDMYNIIHPVAWQYGTGYTHLYHVYFVQGVRQCSTVAGGCYAVSGGYCAYHSSVNFSDIGHTIYSFEGYQNISGCSSPSGRVADSTDSTMSHEMYEAITDPDVNNGTLGWYNSSKGEIGDICRSYYGNVGLNGTTYDIQKEWSNRYSACSFSP